MEMPCVAKAAEMFLVKFFLKINSIFEWQNVLIG